MLLDANEPNARNLVGFKALLTYHGILAPAASFEGEGGKVQPTTEQLTEIVESTLGYFFDQALLSG